MPEAAPRPVLWTFNESTHHRIAVDIAQFSYEALVTADVVIVISLLPERLALPMDSLGNRDL
jgi:hypothetical protein